MATPTNNDRSNRLVIARTRLWLFRIIAIVLPFLFLLMLEGALRLFHYGYDAALFIEAPGNSDYLVFNPAASRRYFTDQLNATTGNREPFRKVKEPGTLRFFVLGESTTIGYPYFHNGSFHRWLQYRLMREFPDRKLEIINVALTAVNSYTVLGFAKEVVHYEPDAVLIYVGHNEYYGALGVGSTNKLGGNPALVNTLLWLRQFRVAQLFAQVVGRVGRLFSSGASKAGKTRMELMVGDQQIPYGSPLFERGIAQFRTNMDKTLAIFHNEGIPVFISNVVSNLKDQAPFIGDSATTDYGQAMQAWDKGDYGTAKVDFIRAKEQDALRFRAPEAINTIIGELTRKYDNTHLVDTRAAFEAASDHGIIGNSLLLEHVHPNLMGYALLSDVFYQALRQQGLIPAAPDPASAESFRKLLRDMPITRVDSLAGAYKIDNLKNNWPFNHSGHDAGPPSRATWHLATEEEDLAYAVAFEHLPWEEAMRQLYDYYSKTEDWAKAATVMEALCLEHPEETSWDTKTAMLLGKLKDNEKAIFYFRQAFNLEPSFDKARYLFVLCLEQDRPAEAIPYLDYAISNNAGGMNLRPVKADALEIIRLEKSLARDSTNSSLLDTIASTYEHMGNKPAALKYTTMARKR
jgi:tetratricopeptide (TPR) repeat protein